MLTKAAKKTDKLIDIIYNSSRPKLSMKICTAVNSNPSYCHRASPAIEDHTVLPATRHR